MGKSIVPPETASLAETRPSYIDRLARTMLFSLLHQLRHGYLIIREGGDAWTFGQTTADGSLTADVTVHHSRFYSHTVFGGSIGAGEAYMAGYWSSEDVTMVMRIILLNREVFEGMDKGWARVMAPLHKAFHLMHRDTRKGSRINIAAHYDVGNDFYALLLDETLTYSCGIFETKESTLKEASLAKYDRICKKLRLNPNDHVVEIGTGWGGFAIHAAANYGCRITGTTISKAQYELAGKRIKEAGLTDRVELVLKDYRDLKGRYDKLVSVEMIEAVGHQYLDAFFTCCSQLLQEDGMMLIQAITIADQVFDQHKRSVDFIKRYIFPGSCIPSVTAMCGSIARATDMRLVHLEDITPHYVRTLSKWRERLSSNIDMVRSLGYPDSFIRMWEYYLCYCEGGFTERYLGDVQMLVTKPLCRIEPLLSPLMQ